MKKNSKIGLWTVLAGGLLAIPRQAHAAHWELTYKINGQIRHMPYGGQVEEKAWSELYPGDPTTGEIQGGQGWSHDILFYSYGGRVSPTGYSGPEMTYPALTTKIDGQITVILTWTKDENDITLPPAPAYVGIKVQGYAFASYNGQESGTDVEAKIGNGESGSTLTVQKERRYMTEQDPYVPPQYVDSKRVSGSYRSVKAVEPETTRVEFSLPLLTRVESPEGSANHGPFGEHYLSAGITAQGESRVVVVTSALEPSWKKWVGTEANLPTEYKTRNSNGTVGNQHNDDAERVIGSETPNDSSDDVWRIKCLRKADGTMEIESAASIIEGVTPPSNQLPGQPTPTPAPYWIGSTTYTANVEGVEGPQYKWEFNRPLYGGHSASEFTGPSAELGFLLAPVTTLSSSNLITGFPVSSTVNVEVTETESGANSAKLTDDYMVNWHTPIEDAEIYGMPVVSYTAHPAYVAEGEQASTSDPDALIDVVVQPKGWELMLLINGQQRAALAGTITAGVIFFFPPATPLTVATLAKLSMRAIGPGLQQGMMAGYAETRQETISNSLAEWQSAVAETQNYLNGSTDQNDIRVSPSSLAITNSDLRQQMAMTPWIVSRFETEFFKGNAYNDHGYEGQAKGHFYYPDQERVVGYYELVAAPENE